MHQPIHAIGRQREMTPERVIGLGFVGILHIVAVSAIVMGLQQHFTRAAPESPIVITKVKDPEITKTVRPQIPNVKLEEHTRVEVPPPRFNIDDGVRPVTGTTRPQPPQPLREEVASIPDTATTGIMSTHSSPAYPLLDRRLGHQGTVTLRLLISPEGTVNDAQVVKSSGYAGLDEAAVAWVIAHWRFHAATHSGAAVESQTSAAVMFSLHNSG
jgi:protein TonB